MIVGSDLEIGNPKGVRVSSNIAIFLRIYIYFYMTFYGNKDLYEGSLCETGKERSREREA